MNIFVFQHNTGDFYNKQDGCLVNEKYIFYTPEFVKRISYSPALIIRINRSGKFIKPEFSGRYYNFIGTAINIYADNYIEDSVFNPLSFFKSSLLDKSSFIKHFDSISNYKFIDDFKIDIDKKISQLSKFSTLKSGDYLLFELSDRIPTKIGESIIYKIEGLEFPEVITE